MILLLIHFYNVMEYQKINNNFMAMEFAKDNVCKDLTLNFDEIEKKIRKITLGHASNLL